ncbi:hypothetical protein [Thiopseudomonas denitrificans]|uniref:hypothetical protein n=1 Tax=Thiopseudomonas denitrificans TaxID=1501432 RepID=UPI000C75F2D6|nr:hypothetical protein [Thiopseudomonas denitrificans]
MVIAIVVAYFTAGWGAGLTGATSTAGNSWVWQSAKGKGHTDETLIQSQLQAQGEIAIRAGLGQCRFDRSSRFCRQQYGH